MESKKCKEAEQCMEEMAARFVAPNVHTYEVMVKGFFDNNRPGDAESLFGDLMHKVINYKLEIVI